jgi:hypothetical protein
MHKSLFQVSVSEVFFDGERLARRDQAKPKRAALDLEAGKGGHFTGTKIIF